MQDSDSQSQRCIVEKLRLETIPLLRLDPRKGIAKHLPTSPLTHEACPPSILLFSCVSHFSLHEVMTRRLMSTCLFYSKPYVHICLCLSRLSFCRLASLYITFFTAVSAFKTALRVEALSPRSSLMVLLPGRDWRALERF